MFANTRLFTFNKKEMANYNKFQTDAASGRLTLPVVILVCLLLWAAASTQWQEAISLLACAITSYLLIEINTAFALIRTRTTLHVSFYVVLATACIFLHPLQPVTFAPIFFLIAIFRLFASYESPQAAGNIFHSFFFIGLGSLLFPQLLYFLPLFYAGMISFRSLSLKSFFAGIIGATTPYWFLFGYAFYCDKPELFYRPLREAVCFQPVSYALLGPEQLVSAGVITLISLIISVYYFNISYLDKVRTRIFLSFLIAAEAWIYLQALLQPGHFNAWFQLQIPVSSILAGHLFTLTRNRFTGIFFIVTFVILTALTIFNLWMQFFNS